MGGNWRAEVREKRGGRREKRGWEAGVPRWQKPGEIEKTSQNFIIFRNRNDTRGGNYYGKGQEAGVEDTGSGSF